MVSGGVVAGMGVYDSATVAVAAAAAAAVLDGKVWCVPVDGVGTSGVAKVCSEGATTAVLG